MTKVLSVPADQVQLFDGITEGTIVMRVNRHEAEQRDPVTCTVTRRPVITVASSLAQHEVAMEVDGQHVHELSRGIVDEQTFDPDQLVRVARPAIMARCSCGYPEPPTGRYEPTRETPTAEGAE